MTLRPPARRLLPRSGAVVATLALALAGCATPGRPVVSVPGALWGEAPDAPPPATKPLAEALPEPAPPPQPPPVADFRLDPGPLGSAPINPAPADPAVAAPAVAAAPPSPATGPEPEATARPEPVPPAVLSPADTRRLARERDVAGLLDRFSLAGKVAVAASSLPANAQVRWLQQGEDFDLRLVGAFGAGATSITSQDGTVTIRTKGGEFITTDPETDLRERLGYAVPVLGLRYWALGLPMPSSQPLDALYDAAGHPVRYRQGAWTVEYADWRLVDGHDLPRRLEARTPIGDRDEASFRLVVTEWKLGAADSPPGVDAD